MQSLLAVTVSGGYAIWIVKDYRLPPDVPYVPFHSDLAVAAQSVGWRWHDLIVWDQNEQRSLVLLGYPSRFYSNQNCSFIVVLRKP
jgi:DNA modification methylase